ncbi:Ig-like domain-containing protein [Streptomyces cheonanensis]|uniref:Ig-like domain-containing protein n=1 Tax=Streptomyces cheonanensis TaxID=312720 RepID=A0ABP5GHF3_9ACTN|nr:Ig-like domain-containing protein [Streptomyces harbinensis]QKV68418.1 L,D-transpeptidase family protein [Streptomyces harbinensis]
MGHVRGISDSAPSRAVASRRTALSCALILAPLLVWVTACSDSSRSLTGTPYDATEQLSFGPAGDSTAAVDPDAPLKITSTDTDGRITDVVATDAVGRTITGQLSEDGSSWHSTTPLAAGASYTVQVSTENDSGRPGRGTHTFTTGDSAAAPLEIELGPTAGTYGVGQPLTAELSEEVADPAERAVVESALVVASEPQVEGSWHWVDDTLLHYRPKEYWPAGSSVTVRSELAGLHIRDGLRGGAAQELQLSIGDRVEALADISGHWMTVSRNGEVLRTIPITTGKEGFATRDGKKVVLGQERNVRMTGTSIGIPAGSSESYDLDVSWATRLTWSGEYVHAAPWSVGSQGSANVSHGCTGMSDANAQWFFETVRPGDIVEHINGFGEDMAPFGNGFGDWNLSWEAWLAGSALHAPDGPAEAAGSPSRLAPAL